MNINQLTNGTVTKNGKTFEFSRSQEGWQIKESGVSTQVTPDELSARLDGCVVLQQDPFLAYATPKLGPFEVPVGTEPY